MVVVAVAREPSRPLRRVCWNIGCGELVVELEEATFGGGDDGSSSEVEVEVVVVMEK